LISAKTLKARLEVSIDMMCDYLFSHPEVSNLILSNIAVAMDLAADKNRISLEAKARILAVWNTVLNFISAENFLRPMLKTTSRHAWRVGYDES
jgi:hypothetical protein